MTRLENILDPYSPLWRLINATNGNIPRSLGAAAAGEGDDDGDGDADAVGADGASGDAKGGDDDGASVADIPAWRKDIKDAKQAKYAEQFLTPADAVDAAFKQRQQLSTAILPLAEGATDDEVAAHRKKIGVPAEAAGYEIVLPEGIATRDDLPEEHNARIGRFLDIAHANHVPEPVVNAFLAWYDAEGVAELKGLEEKQAEDLVKLNDDLDKRWGDDSKRNRALADRTMQRFSPSASVTQKLNEAMGDAELVDFFARVGASHADDRFVLGATEDEAKSIDAELEELMKAKDYWTDPAKQNRARELHVQLHGTRPVVGEAQRGL